MVIERLNEGSLVPVESPDVEDNTDVDNTSVLNLGFSLENNVSKELAPNMISPQTKRSCCNTDRQSIRCIQKRFAGG